LDKRTVEKVKREKLQRIIETCRLIVERGLDPFSVDVEDFLEVLREYQPSLENMEDIVLDSEALNQVASVINLQSEWIKKRSTSLYTDPFLIQEKLKALDVEKLARLFLKVWRPIVELEQITTKSLAVSAKYWRDLLPLDVRWSKTGYRQLPLGSSTYEDLVKRRIISEKTFSEELEELWKELLDRVGDKGKILYQEFVYVESYPETLRRAYLTSFLVTYGYAKLEVYPFEEEIYLVPLKVPTPPSDKENVMSYPIPISYEDWLEWRKNR